jgi:hypothetical protein
VPGPEASGLDATLEAAYKLLKGKDFTQSVRARSQVLPA